MTLERCLACGEHAVEERVDSVTLTRGGRSATYEDRRMVCAACGNASYRGAQAGAHELTVATAERELDGLLSAADLCAIRSKYRLRQADMEQILSTGPKTWTRWERGKITQTRAADRFIRAIADDPYLARRLMRDAGVENPEAEEVFARIEHDERLRARAALRAELGRRGGILDDRIAEIAADQAFEVVHRTRAEAVAASPTSPRARCTTSRGRGNPSPSGRSCCATSG